ncbi:hypothetical protein Ga0123462_2027 [Mariprofundus ferrinatatus]|jgi:hypothetical protein|uniref:Uncharacterized protein n=1 Tax=Mariprofundus ferrinatatus TaxID=1921087 RepID=A0A2K8LD86_9PROT|nr:hypothetical protein [Mariprofundus ferrinatatus]ATX82864.1 hypothetical protein Ga0123462_2027 [Mariprofundus ferrinatatus]
MSDNRDEKKDEVDKASSASAVHPLEENSKPASTLSRVFGFLLLVIVIIAGGLAANGQLMPMIDSIKASLESQQATETEGMPAEPEVAEIKPEPVSRPVAPEPEPVVPDVSSTVAASREAEALLSTIEQLRAELQNMEASQKSLQRGLREQQRMNLQVRLRWITDPASRAPQIQLAWEEISLLPGLSSAERSRAEEMHTLARANVQKLNAWQAALLKWIDALETPTHQDVMPKPEHPWLAWIVGQFHLRQAPTVESRRLGSLRDRLQHVSRSLTLEQWPADGEWQSLHAELLLQAKAMHPETAESAIDLGLPENFTAIQEDMNTLRDAARQWAQSAQGAF